MNLEERLERLCAKHGKSPHISGLFTIGEFTYATNGVIIARIPRLHLFDLPGINAAKDILFPDGPEDDWITLNEEQFRCTCDDKDGECPECDGSGNIEFESDYNTYKVTCETCGGSGEGKSPCEICDNLKSVQIGENYVALKSIHLARTIGKIRINPIPQKLMNNSEKSECIQFSFDGGVGVIMIVTCRGSLNIPIELLISKVDER